MSIENIPHRLLYPIPEARALLGNISHSGFYKFVNQGLIKITKVGRRSFVTHDELLAAAAAWSQGASPKPNTAADNSRESRPSAA